MKNVNTSTCLLLAGFVAAPIAASATSLFDLNLAGNTQTEGWEGLTAANNPGYPGFFEFADPWPAPIAPSIPGSAGNSGFDKVSGGGYPASGSIYNFTLPGTFAIDNTNSLAGLETVALQLDLGEGDGFFVADPVLSYNGGSQNLTADFQQSAPGPTAFTNPQTGDPDSSTVFAFQWDLSTVGPINDFAITWTTDAHSTAYNLQLDSSDTFTGNALSAVPEPSAFAVLAGVMALGLVALRRRR